MLLGSEEVHNAGYRARPAGRCVGDRPNGEAPLTHWGLCCQSPFSYRLLPSKSHSHHSKQAPPRAMPLAGAVKHNGNPCVMLASLSPLGNIRLVARPLEVSWRFPGNYLEINQAIRSSVTGLSTLDHSLCGNLVRITHSSFLLPPTHTCLFVVSCYFRPFLLRQKTDPFFICL